MGRLKTFVWFVKSQSLLFLSLIGVVIGISAGFLLKKYNASVYWYMWLGLPGELFLQALQMAIIPVIVANLVLMSSRTEMKQQGKLVAIVIAYSLALGTASSFLSIIITVIIKPGMKANNSIPMSNLSSPVSELGFNEMLSDLFRNLVPSNLVEACLSTIVTKCKQKVMQDNSTIPVLISEKVPRTNLIGLMACSVLFGLVAGKCGHKASTFLSVIESISIIATEILKILIKTMPVGVFSLMVTAFSNIGSINETLSSMGWFVLCVLLSLLVVHLLLHPIIYLILIRGNPFKFIIALFKPWFMGFTTLSSMITIPELQRSLITFGLKEKIVKMVIPLSLGVGSCGSVVFVSGACVFISQINGNNLPIGALVSLGFLSPINVTALPAVPSASIMGIIVLLDSLNSSVLLVPILFATEFILDRFRTGTNVVSIGLGCSLVDKYCTNKEVTPLISGSQLDSNFLNESISKVSLDL